MSGREDVFDRNRRKANGSPVARWLDGRADDYDDAGKHYRPCGPECLFDHVRPDGRCRWTGQGVAS